MTLIPPLPRAWLQGIARPVLVTWFGLIGVALLGMVSQLLVRLPVVPGLRGVAAIALGLLPEVGAMMLPVALFLGTVAVARRWAESGDLAALYASGAGARRLVPALLLVGVVGGAVVAGVAHSLAPEGRAQARRTVAASGSTIRLEAGRPAWVGGTLVMAEQTDNGELSSVFVAKDDVVAIAPRAVVTGEGTVGLESGSARGIGAATWSMEFERLSIPVRLPAPRVHSTELADARLAGLIARMEQEGRSAHAEKLVLFKRTTLGLGTPLLVLLALPLGARSRWAMPGAIGSILGLWGVQRIGDHLASSWGALPCALLPIAVLAIAVVIAWQPWEQR